MLLRVVMIGYIDVDETNKEVWPPEDGSPAEITQEQLADGEIEIGQMVDESMYEHDEPFNHPHFIVTEVTDTTTEIRNLAQIQDFCEGS